MKIRKNGLMEITFIFYRVSKIEESRTQNLISLLNP